MEVAPPIRGLSPDNSILPVLLVSSVTTFAKNKSGHLKHAPVILETDSGCNTGKDTWCKCLCRYRYQSKWEIDFCDIFVAALQRGQVKPPQTLKSFCFTCSEMYASVILHQSKGKKKEIGLRSFKLSDVGTSHRQQKEMDCRSSNYFNSIYPCSNFCSLKTNTKKINNLQSRQVDFSSNRKLKTNLLT